MLTSIRRLPFRLLAAIGAAIPALWKALVLATEVCATDDTGMEICLEQPASRIAALSPGVTDLDCLVPRKLFCQKLDTARAKR